MVTRLFGKVTRLNLNGDVSTQTINNGVGDTTLIGRVGVSCCNNGGGSVEKYVAVINLSDWYLQNNYYMLDINHNLDSNNPLLNIRSGNDLIQVHETAIIDNNNMQFRVPVSPDCRFTGEAVLVKV